jgi:hypothetical protein
VVNLSCITRLELEIVPGTVAHIVEFTLLWFTVKSLVFFLVVTLHFFLRFFIAAVAIAYEDDLLLPFFLSFLTIFSSALGIVILVLSS